MKMIVSVALALAIASILLGPIVTAVSSNTGTQTVTNETVTANVGNYTDLDGFKLVQGSATVYGYNQTSGSYEVATAGTDYELDTKAGRLKALSGSSLIDDGETVKVSYDYEATTGTTTKIIQYGPTFVVLLMLTTVGAKVTESL